MDKQLTDQDMTHPELHQGNIASRLNWLRAAVLGANDGIVSTSGLVLGVAAATESTSIILAAGIAGTIAGAISMAAGEYVSVSSARDTEKALIEKETYELAHYPQEELEELIGIYQKKGLSAKTATAVAKELTAKDAFRAHLDAELNINPDELTNPWHASFASAISFFLGALIPMIAITVSPMGYRIPITFVSIVVALAATGAASGRLSGTSLLKVMLRVVLGGVLAMAITYGIGKIFHISGI